MYASQSSSCNIDSTIVFCSVGGQGMRRGPEVETRIRRTTEREGRRARRRRARELGSNLPKHIDGMSSDDEVTEQQNLAFKQTKGGSRFYLVSWSTNLKIPHLRFYIIYDYIFTRYDCTFFLIYYRRN